MAASTLLTALADPVLAAAVLARMSAAVFAGALPLADQVPLKVRGVLAVCLAVLALPAAAHNRAASLAAQPWPAVVLGEAVAGLGLGLVAAAIVAAAAWAGGLLGSVSGLSWADDFATPAGDPEPTGVARLAWWLGVAGFFAAGGHLAVVAGLFESVRLMPVGSLFAAGGAESPLVAVVAAAPAVALSLVTALAVPALAAVVTFHLALAICLRTVRFDPGQGLLQALAAIVVMFAFIAGAEAWLGGFGAVAHAQIERSFAGEPACPRPLIHAP
jgi:flagellar biosynthetic protein FliR